MALVLLVENGANLHGALVLLVEDPDIAYATRTVRLERGFNAPLLVALIGVTDRRLMQAGFDRRKV